MLTKEQKSEIVSKFGGKTGSPEVQVALMTARINYLQEHFQVINLIITRRED